MYLAVIGLALLGACVIVQSLGMLLLVHWLTRATTSSSRRARYAG